MLLAVRPSRLDAAAPDPPLAPLPDPEPVLEHLRGTPYAAEVERLAREILAHRFPLLGFTVETGPEIRWRRDYVNGIESPALYFRRIPYLDLARAGDHKNIWELNRHQHLVLLAQAFRLAGDAVYVREIERQLTGWLEANPFARGINWTSALEVAFRALSWIWVYHLAGGAIAPSLRARWLEALYRHGVYLEYNLSVYFSPNTHLLGEAVALHALGTAFPVWPRAAKWRSLGGATTLRQLERQVRPDGSHFEQSTYYHVYTLDFFLLHSIFAPSAIPRERLQAMASYLAALLGVSGSLPFFGDDDGGRLFHPYGPRDRFAGASLAAAAALAGGDWNWCDEERFELAAWWLGERAFTRAAPAERRRGTQCFGDAGMAVIDSPAAHVVVKAGGFGAGGSGHSHADALSLTVEAGGECLLGDAGTFTYVGDPAWRDWFRGTAAHNTVRIGRRSQAVPVNPFRWTQQPQVERLHWAASAGRVELLAVCRQVAGEHRRHVLFVEPDLLVVLDRVDGTDGIVEQFWHTPGEFDLDHSPRIGFRGRLARLLLPAGARLAAAYGEENGWRSPVFGVRQPSGVVAVEADAPAVLAAAVDLSGRWEKIESAPGAAGGWRVALSAPGASLAAQFSPEGPILLT